ncbi:hypothetical protein [Thermococcus sp. Bubb.Bath]|uniref:hypothetical protein n=1 Tax=Thermococcus sp. Bubb.Bath TaxID=1638242 RepID=UPI00143ADE0C|nr:hypothetical protein [Thermococcus sp. Bubb.Bath]NJF25970.1 hypothetical protein [Thermococcus sp. Bubb.Bath]
MGLIFQTPEESEVVKPFEALPFGINLGSSLGVLFSDEHAEAVFLAYTEASLLERGAVYHVNVGGGFSPSLLRRVKDNLEGFYFGKAFRLQTVLDALNSVEGGASFVVAGFPLLKGISADGIVEAVETAGEKGVTLILTHSPLSLNELDLPLEFRNYFLLPELFDYLIVARTAAYRGHYRMNLSLLRAPADFLGSLGEHTIPLDDAIKALL